MQEAKWEFDLYKQYLLNIFRENCQIKLRYYVLRGLSLAAQSNAIETKFALGGYQALSSADPYPGLSIGDGKNDINSGVSKSVTDANSCVLQNLNPDFFKNYELDGFLPADWRLKLFIYNKGGILGDKLIGEHECDVEDRFYNDLFRLRQYSLEKRTENFKNKMKLLTGKDDASRNKKLHLENEILRLRDYLKPLILERTTQPIEYAYLAQPGTNTMQGSVEVLIEVLHPDDVRKIPAPKFEPPKPSKYQIRLIIWEAFDIPLDGKKAIDPFFKVTLDNEGWSSDEITKVGSVDARKRTRIWGPTATPSTTGECCSS